MQDFQLVGVLRYALERQRYSRKERKRLRKVLRKGNAFFTEDSRKLIE